MSILDVMDEIKKDNSAINSIKHPARRLVLDQKLYYLYGVAAIMNADGVIKEEENEYLKTLMKIIEIDESYFNEFIRFAKNPDKETMNSIINIMLKINMTAPFLLDLLLMSYSDGELHEDEINTYNMFGEFLGIEKKILTDIIIIAKHINENDIVSLFKSLIDKENFMHVYDFFYLLEEELENVVDDINLLEDKKCELYHIRSYFSAFFSIDILKIDKLSMLSEYIDKEPKLDIVFIEHHKEIWGDYFPDYKGFLSSTRELMENDSKSMQTVGDLAHYSQQQNEEK